MKLQTLDRSKQQRRRGRASRARKKVRGIASRPRLTVFRSNRYIYAQVIDDTEGRTLLAASTRDADLKGAAKSADNLDAARALGKKIADLAKEKGISEIVFDKGWYRYHGRVRALADAARESGLKF